MISIKLLNRDELFKLIYGSGGSPKIKDLEERIKYFKYNDTFQRPIWVRDAEKDRRFFVVLFDNKKIIGISKLTESPYSEKPVFWIQYLSIDEKYREKGYSKLMVDELLKFAKENNIIIETSGYSKLGWNRVRDYLHTKAEEYGVELIDTRKQAEFESVKNEIRNSQITNSKIINFSKFLNENFDEHIKNVFLEKIERLNIMTTTIDGKLYLYLFHGTSFPNYKKIIKTGKFNSGTFFTSSDEEARRYSMMTNTKKPVILAQYIAAESLFTSGDYFIAKHDILNNKHGSSIYENCDSVQLINGNKLRWEDYDAYPFLFLDDLFLIGQVSSSHHDIVIAASIYNLLEQKLKGYLNIIKLENDFDIDIYANDNEEELTDKYWGYVYNQGRIWIEHNVIAFWDNISIDTFNKIQIYLNKEFNININNNWIIEYYDNNLLIQKTVYNFLNNIDIDIYDKNISKDELEQQKLLHVMSPINKKNVKNISGFGSDKTGWDSPMNISNRQKIYQESNKNIISFSKFSIFENQNENEMFIPNDILEIHKLFKAAGYDIYIVGGAVRDFVLGVIPHDYDLVTNATPDITKKILKNYRTDLQGAHFGVIRVFTEDCPEGYEIASYRKDISKGRNTKGNDQKVEIGQHLTLADDLQRRDLTQNALVYDIDKKEIIDLVGGVEDIKNKIIRAVGEPSKRFEEDKLRILRAIRFAARSHSKLDEKTADAIKNDHQLRGISQDDDVSQERIVEEIQKMFDYCANKNDLLAWNNYIQMIFDFDLWDEMFPNAKISDNVLDIKILDLPIFYTVLFENNNPDRYFEKNLTEEYKLSSKLRTVEKIIFFNNFNNLYEDINNVYLLKKLQNRYAVSGDDLLKYAEVKNINLTFVKAFIKYNFTINGNDLMKLGYKGIELGKEIEKREKELFSLILNENYDF